MKKINSLKDRALMMKENIDDYIRKNPKKLVLVAAGIGVVVGVAITAVMMRRKE